MLYNNNTNNFALALIKYTKHCRSSKNRKNLLYTMRSHLYLEKTFDSTLVPSPESSLSLYYCFNIYIFANMSMIARLVTINVTPNVENNGFEPMTPCLQSRCSTS